MFVVRCCFSVSLVAEPSLDWARNASMSSVPHERFRVPGFVQVPPPLMLTGFDRCVAGENNPKGLVFEPAAPSLLVSALEGCDEVSSLCESAEIATV